VVTSGGCLRTNPQNLIRVMPAEGWDEFGCLVVLAEPVIRLLSLSFARVP
jgi:hypothetical protein